MMSVEMNDGLQAYERGGGVLLVEDDALYMTLYRNSLRALDPDIVLIECEDAYEALQRLMESTPKLVILDLHMPAFDGYNFIAIVKSKPAYADLAVIVITSDRGEKTRQLMQPPNVFVLYKPVRPADLMALASPFVKPALASVAGRHPRADAYSEPPPIIEMDGWILREFAAIFFEQVPSRIAELQQATVQACTTSGNYSGLREWIHAMRGTASFVNANGLNHLIERLSGAVNCSDTALITTLEKLLVDEMKTFAIDLDHHYHLSLMGSDDCQSLN